MSSDKIWPKSLGLTLIGRPHSLSSLNWLDNMDKKKVPNLLDPTSTIITINTMIWWMSTISAFFSPYYFECRGEKNTCMYILWFFEIVKIAIGFCSQENGPLCRPCHLGRASGVGCCRCRGCRWRSQRTASVPVGWLVGCSSSQMWYCNN